MNGHAPEARSTKSLNESVRSYWGDQPCGSTTSSRPKYTREYFEDIENYRYAVEPEIFSFAQFTRYAGKRVLEVGVGSGTDFLQWVRAGADAVGVDVTVPAVEHTRRRLQLYGLSARLAVADAETLPFRSGTFDLVYSWGVIHHTADTRAALREVVRVTRPGGRCKVMVYNRHSMTALGTWARWALLKGRPWKSISWSLSHHMESPGTKAFTVTEIHALLAALPVERVRIERILTFYDRFGDRGPALRQLARAATFLPRDRVGWWITVDMQKDSRIS